MYQSSSGGLDHPDSCSIKEYFLAHGRAGGVDPARLDPVLLDCSDGRAAQKARYGGELFPAELPEGASGRTFLEFFQIDRQTGLAKGIIQLDLQAQDFIAQVSP